MNKIIIFLLCVAGALLNIVTSRFSFSVMFLDTIWTISATLLAGPFWGALTGLLTNVIVHSLQFWGWEGYLFALCNMATALITYLFMRLFPRELSLESWREAAYDSNVAPQSRRFALVIGRIIVLILLSFALAVAISVLGGLISALIQIFNPARIGTPDLSPEKFFGMFAPGFSLILKEILVRIPMNMLDRPISAFAGYGIAFGLLRLYKKMKKGNA